MINNAEVIFKYVLLNIYTQKWKQGQKIPSKNSFAIKFSCSVSEVMKALDKLKQNGFIIALERKGYYVSQKSSSYFFYSISDFNKAKEIKTSLLQGFIINNEIVKIINTEAKKFTSFIQAQKTAFQRKYYFGDKLEKEAYFIFQDEIFKKFQDPSLLKTKPLYEFLALNGLIITRNAKFAFFSDVPSKNTKSLNKRCWVIIEFIYDIDNMPIAILFINYYDQNSNNILYRRDVGINK